MAHLIRSPVIISIVLVIFASPSWALYDVYDLGAILKPVEGTCDWDDGPKVISNLIGEEIVIAGTTNDFALAIWDGAVPREDLGVGPTIVGIFGIDDNNGTIAGQYVKEGAPLTAMIINPPYSTITELELGDGVGENLASDITQSSTGANTFFISGAVIGSNGWRAVRWMDVNLEPEVFDPIPSYATGGSYAEAVNSGGFMVGYSWLEKNVRATRWGAAPAVGDEISDTTTICEPNRDWTAKALDINSQGQITGAIAKLIEFPLGGCSPVNVGFVANLSGQVEELPRYVNDKQVQSGTAWAQAINNNGVVVGNASPAPDSICEDSRATLWRKIGATWEIEDLNTQIVDNSGWVLLDAYDINDRGQIIGIGRFDDSGSGVINEDTPMHGFVLSPEGTPVRTPTPPVGRGPGDPGVTPARKKKKKWYASSGVIELCLLIFVGLYRGVSLKEKRKFKENS